MHRANCDAALFATVLDTKGTRYYLTAEPLPAGPDWDWAAWRSGDTDSSLHGRASSGAEAMAEAIQAVLDLV